MKAKSDDDPPTLYICCSLKAVTLNYKTRFILKKDESIEPFLCVIWQLFG